MKHLKKFEHNFSEIEHEENEKKYNFIEECVVELKDKYKISTSNDKNRTVVNINLPGQLPSHFLLEIKDILDSSEKNLELYKDIDYLIEKVCIDREIKHMVQLHHNSRLRIIFNWENESPF